MTKFAAYDSVTIYATGDTAEAAVAAAREETREPEAEFDTAPIGDDLAAWIDENGWNGSHRSFAVRDGMIVDTTDE